MLQHPLATQEGGRAQVFNELPRKLPTQTKVLVVLDCECVNNAELIEVWNIYHEQVNLVFFNNIYIQGLSSKHVRLPSIFVNKDVAIVPAMSCYVEYGRLSRDRRIT